MIDVFICEKMCFEDCLFWILPVLTFPLAVANAKSMWLMGIKWRVSFPAAGSCEVITTDWIMVFNMHIHFNRGFDQPHVLFCYRSGVMRDIGKLQSTTV